MLVYRVEDKLGYGPYHSPLDGKFSDKLCGAHANPMTHPTSWTEELPSEYELGWKENQLRHGFGSMRRLNEWFDEYWKKELKKHKFYISIYQVNPRYVRTSRSKKQTIFNIDKATFIKRMDII